MSDEKSTQRIVLEYLKAKGFKKALKEVEKNLENGVMDIVTDPLVFTEDVHVGDTSKKIITAYQNLVEWIAASLDLYKTELERVLFPVFVHCYLELVSKVGKVDAYEKSEACQFLEKYKKNFIVHSQEIITMKAIQCNAHLRDHDFVKTVKNKFQVEISQITYELLIKYLNDSSDVAILAIINRYINFKILKILPSVYSSNSSATMEEQDGLDDEEDKNLSLKKVSWEIRTQHVPSRRGRKKKVDTATISKNIPPSICFYTFFNSHVNAIDMAVTPERPIIAGGYEDGTVKVWQNEKYEELIGHSGPVYSVNFSQDKKWLLSSSEDGTARLWNLDTKSNLVVYKGHQYPVWDVNFSKIDYLFATASHDKTARIWSTDRVTPLRVLVGHNSDVDVVKFHPNCNYLATGSSDKTVRLWDVNSGECVRVFQGHYSSIHSLAFSNDGRYLASGGADQEVYVWDISTQKCVNHLHGHTDTVWSLAFNDDGSLLTSGSHDCSVKIWNMQDATTFYTKQTPVMYVNFQRNCIMAAGPFQAPREL